MLPQCLLASMVSGEKTVKFRDIFYVTHCFSFATFKILLLSLDFNSLAMMFPDMDLCEFSILGVLWSSWTCRWMFASKFENVLSSSFQVFFLILSVSVLFWGHPFCMCWYTWWCPTFLSDCSIFFILYLSYFPLA